MSLKVFEKLKEEDKVLFNSRKTPLTVVDIKEDSKIIEGPKKGVYELYLSESDDILVCRKGDRSYSSYVEELREVGFWKKIDEKIWEHSKTGLKIELVQKETGYWFIESNEDKEIVDQPLYGFNDLEVAKDVALDFLDNNPEGKA